MSDFENRIFEKMRLQEEEEIRARAEQEAYRLVKMEEAAREAKLQEQATLLGMQAVKLLQRYSVPSMPVWELAPTGRKVKNQYSGGKSGSPYERIEDEVDYFHTGQGWSIYTSYFSESRYDPPSSSRSIALTDSGKIVDNYTGAGWKRQRLNGTPIQGIIDPQYSRPDTAIRCINGENFQQGIASLVRGKGKYITYTD